MTISKRSLFTQTTPLPHGISREVAIRWLHNHREMIELNPLVLRYRKCQPAANSPKEEHACTWYEITDRINYLPGGMMSGEVTYKAAFHDLPSGLQTHVYAPAGLDLREKWSVCGNEPGEPREPFEMGIGAPRDGLYIREDVDMRCNVFLHAFVKRNLSKAHKVVVNRVVEMADTGDATTTQTSTGKDSLQSSLEPPASAASRQALDRIPSSHTSVPVGDPQSVQSQQVQQHPQARGSSSEHPRPDTPPSPEYVPSFLQKRHTEPLIDDEKPLPRLPIESVPYEPFRYVKIPSSNPEPELFSGNFHPLSHYQLLFGNDLSGAEPSANRSRHQSLIQAELPANSSDAPSRLDADEALPNSALPLDVDPELSPKPLVPRRPRSAGDEWKKHR